MDLEDRIFRAYFRNYPDGQAPGKDIEYISYRGYDYAVLTNVNGILAVYRIKDDKSLKGINPEWFDKIVYHFKL